MLNEVYVKHLMRKQNHGGDKNASKQNIKYKF